MNIRFHDIFGFLTVTFLYPIAERQQKRLISPKLRVLKAEAALPFSQRKALAAKRLSAILMHAKNTVPYYRDLFQQCSFDPESVNQDIRYFFDLPYLTKDILREQGKRLISTPYEERIVRAQKTGSSTGLAATIYYDQDGLDWTAAQNILMLEWGGKHRCNREAHLSTRFSSIPREAIHFERRKCFVLNRCNIYTDGFGDAAQEVLLEDLRKARARVVQGHPSSLYALAKYLKKNNKQAPELFEIFVTTGEMLTQRQRQTIENVLHVRISNRYGACEFGVMAQELASGPKGQMLVSDSLVWPESIAGEGEGTELVFTNLRNNVMPLIRYRIGDLGTLEERADGWWISKLTGRVHDTVTIGDTTCPTHYIQDILDRCGPISDFQIMERDGIARELRLVTPPEHWEQVKVAVQEYFPSLPLRRIDAEQLVFVGIRGKFSYLVREGI
ncbi:hypothetical protein DSECCO2_108430 [anaerobic digester metagenome]